MPLSWSRMANLESWTAAAAASTNFLPSSSRAGGAAAVSTRNWNPRSRWLLGHPVKDHLSVASKGIESSKTSSITSKEQQRDGDDTPPPGCSRIKVELKKPLGLVLQEDVTTGNIFVSEVSKDGNAAKSGLVDVGDQLIATSAVVYTDEEQYQGVYVRKGMQVVRLNVRGEKFDTVVAAIGTHPGYMAVTLELQKCKPLPTSGSNNGAAS